jgi:hypothetical protein
MNCKPGDLAFIVKAAFPQNIGVVVEVESLWGHHPIDGPCWNIRSRTPLLGVRYGSRVVYADTEAFIADFCLRPISGVPVGEYEMESTTEGATV